jgi:hypothetical protein
MRFIAAPASPSALRERIGIHSMHAERIHCPPCRGQISSLELIELDAFFW